MEEYIKLLELPEEFDLSDLKKAYRKKVLKYHPDKAGNEAERIGYEALMKKLNEANEYLKEYLEQHGGRYTKATQNDTYSNNTEDTQKENHEEPQEETSYNEDDEAEDYEEDTPQQTEPVYKSIAIHSIDYKLVFNGKLYLYPDRLIFESNANVIKKYTKVIWLSKIKELRKVNKLKHVLEIIDSEDNIDIFVLDKRTLWLDKIYNFIDENNVPLSEIDANCGLHKLKFKYSLEETYKGIVKFILAMLILLFLMPSIFDFIDTHSYQQQEQEYIEEDTKDNESSTDNLNNESSPDNKEVMNSYMGNLYNKIGSNWANKPVSNYIFND